MKVLFVVVLALSCSFYTSEACTSGGIVIKGDDREVKLGQGKLSKSDELKGLSLEDTKHLSITSVLDEDLPTESFDDLSEEKIQIIFQIGGTVKPSEMKPVMTSKSFNKMDKRFFKKLRKHVKRVLKKMDPVEVSQLDFELLLGTVSVDFSGLDWQAIAQHLTASSLNKLSSKAWRRLPLGLIKQYLRAGELEQLHTSKEDASPEEYDSSESSEGSSGSSEGSSEAGSEDAAAAASDGETAAGSEDAAAAGSEDAAAAASDGETAAGSEDAAAAGSEDAAAAGSEDAAAAGSEDAAAAGSEDAAAAGSEDAAAPA